MNLSYVSTDIHHFRRKMKVSATNLGVNYGFSVAYVMVVDVTYTIFSEMTSFILAKFMEDYEK